MLSREAKITIDPKDTLNRLKVSWKWVYYSKLGVLQEPYLSQQVPGAHTLFVTTDRQKSWEPLEMCTLTIGETRSDGRTSTERQEILSLVTVNKGSS